VQEAARTAALLDLQEATQTRTIQTINNRNDLGAD
jgi:hypothetical protein